MGLFQFEIIMVRIVIDSMFKISISIIIRWIEMDCLQKHDRSNQSFSISKPTWSVIGKFKSYKSRLIVVRANDSFSLRCHLCRSPPTHCPLQSLPNRNIIIHIQTSPIPSVMNDSNVRVESESFGFYWMKTWRCVNPYLEPQNVLKSFYHRHISKRNRNWGVQVDGDVIILKCWESSFMLRQNLT